MSAHASANKQNAGFSSPSPPPSGTNCWICFEDDGRLLRNCACRGDASGYAHVSCLAEHARTVSDKAIAGEDRKIVCYPWVICPNCKQEYYGDVSFEMAEAFVEYASRLPNDRFSDRIRFNAQVNFGIELEDSGDWGEARTIYERLLNSLKPSDTKRKMAREALLAGKMADNFAKEGKFATDESKVSDCFRKAVPYYEKAHRIYVEVCGEESEEALRFQNVLATFSGDTASFVSSARALCDATKAKYGSESGNALIIGSRLARALHADGKLQEASELLEETIVKARRIFGPEHKQTLAMKSHLEEIAVAAAAKTRKRSVNGEGDKQPSSKQRRKI